MSTESGYITMEDGPRLFFEKAGSGPRTLVLINGFYLLDDFKYLANGRTLVALDLRNRGRSDFIVDSSKLQRGVHQDVDDLEAVRRHFGIDQIDLIGHSYAGVIPGLYAMKYPAHAGRIVQIGAVQPNAGTEYPPELSNVDATLTEFFTKSRELAESERQRQTPDFPAFCKKMWALLRVIYVADPADAGKLQHWEHCDLQTELNLMKYWLENIRPSLQTVRLTADTLAVVKSPSLVVHGKKDRSSAYGGGRDWASMLPDARLLTIEDAAHVPWIESPERVLGAIQTFLDGQWPETAQAIRHPLE